MKTLGMVLRWFAAIATLGLLAVTLLALPFRLYAVQTGSMQPTFGPRALVVVHKGDPVLGRPISFTHHGAVITHRLVSAIWEANAVTGYVTKGDANKTADPWVVKPSEVIGGVAWSAPALGYWLIYFKMAPGWGSAILSCLGLYLMWSIAHEFDSPRKVTEGLAA